MERRLAAILAADVVGYSRLIGADEERTLRTLSAYREVIDGLVAAHRGRIFGTAGDSVIAEFASPVEAVRCAAEVQQELGKRNADIAPDRRMEFRIGVNLGDVVVEGDDLLGNGVNIAARLQELADPSGIYVSDDIHRHVEGKIDVSFADLGDQSLKNIATPVRVHRVEMRDTGLGGAPAASVGPPLPDKPSIAVLPFENMSGDTEQEYFADGITEEIITTLSKISKLFVIARNSTLVYKGRAINVKQVGREQGVRYVLEGSVRRGSNRMRITAQLIEAAAGHHLWAQRYDREIGDIFALQDEITKEVVSALQVELTEGEQARLAARGTENLEAWQLTFQARTLVHEHHQDGVHKARVLLEQALRLDGKYALAWGVLAAAHWTQALNQGWSASRDGSLELAIEASDRSLALDPSNAGALAVRGLILLSYRDFDEALALVEKALLSAHSQANTLATAAITLLACGKPEEAIKQINKAIRHCPIYPAWYLFQLGASYWALGQSEKAIAAARSAVESDPDFSYAFVLLAMVYSETNSDAEARDAAAEVLRIDPDFSLRTWANGMPYRDPELEARQLAALRKSELPE